MYVCVCNAITDREVSAAVAGGATGADEVFRHFGTEMRCGRCVATMRGLIGETGCAGERRHVGDAETPAGRKRCHDCVR